MKLISARIQNYRSIEDINISFENNTKIFVGLSETGKSNLLKALNTLSSSCEINKRDIREDIDSTKSSNIKFFIILEDDDKKTIKEQIEKCCFNLNMKKILMNAEGENLGIEYFLNRKYIYSVDVSSGKRLYTYYEINNEKYKLNDKIKFIDATEQSPVKILNGDILIKNKVIYFISDDPFVEDETKIKDANLDEINAFISNIILEYIKNYKWNVLFWKYDEKNILPSEINTEEFVNNPDSCIPLKKLFELYGIKDIKKEYDLKKSTGRANSFDNLLEKISKNTTDYLRKKWKSMSKDTKVTISESGPNIRISIKDSKNKFDMLDRSDGYKRLLTFLILISIDNTNSVLRNSLLLIDCPEAEIDIPGQRYLRDELIEIGKNNYVFYSTHSPYMVDSSNIFRHYIVTKNNEITNITLGEEANYNDSAILFNALGTSMFENVNELNIAFEGWSDKQLYYAGQKLLSVSDKKELSDIGICQLGGLRNANAFAATWELVCKIKKYKIISDSDEPGLQQKKKFLEEHLNENVEWLTYSDLVKTSKKIETAEDFIVHSKIKKICDAYISDKDDAIPISIEKLKDSNVPNMVLIDNWIKQFGYDKETLRSEKNKIKEAIFTDLKKEDIVEEYVEVLKEIIKLKNVK